VQGVEGSDVPSASAFTRSPSVIAAFFSSFASLKTLQSVEIIQITLKLLPPSPSAHGVVPFPLALAGHTFAFEDSSTKEMPQILFGLARPKNDRTTLDAIFVTFSASFFFSSSFCSLSFNSPADSVSKKQPRRKISPTSMDNCVQPSSASFSFEAFAFSSS